MRALPLGQLLSKVPHHRYTIRYAAFAFIFVSVVYLLYNGQALGVSLPLHPVKTPDTSFWSFPPPPGAQHPIDSLIKAARDRFDALMVKRSKHRDDAASRYRERRGRHPPPGFDDWWKHAKKTDAIVVEDFFDRIYDDLNPFWGMPVDEIRSRANAWPHVVRVRDGIAHGDGNTTKRVPWLQHWTDLVAEAAQHLPDVDMPINYMDESRIIAPYEKISELVGKEQKMRSVIPISEVLDDYPGLATLDEKRGEDYQPEWITKDSPHFWNLARESCPPGSPGREAAALDSYDAPPKIPGVEWKPAFAPNGFVANYTASADICTQEHLRGLHGTFIEPISISTTKELIPLFGGSKLRANNEILIPGAMYLTKDEFYSGGDDLGPDWEKKKDGVIWRGKASGGRHKKENWRHMHRLRLLEMLNGTTVSVLEKGERDMAGTFGLPDPQLYPLSEDRRGKMGEWLTEHADAGANDLGCHPVSNCGYLNGAFEQLDSMPMREQYAFKILPDVDGNSFSGRFRGFMRSSSLPVKATIYAEWHDDRLVPWLHFVPLDNTFRDLYGVLDWFTRDERGDAAARMVAETGAWWASRALRREDMLLYTWRLLLEWARVCDERRERLGWVGDLRENRRFGDVGQRV